MNRIHPNKLSKAIDLCKAGESIRFIAEVVGINKTTAWTIQRRLKTEIGTIFCACGKVAGHKGWCGPRIAKSPARSAYMANCWRDIRALNIFIPSRPRYERPDIPNERETEIPLLVSRKRYTSLDASYFGDPDRDGHLIVPSGALTPLELLMLKEEQESLEYQERERHLREFQTFETKKRLGIVGR